ncbi:YjfB family protein [Paenibacillus oenotherae]|uniref:YjfB family protein n=1 Tax=Paenibacillus oenotherae TaxID=1435645 RepID=A0ABS7D7X9_9BACL|nr:YjfB family protein [Paenibacillus oenotherae]MBW7476039.1 YjfB family protein [Paenibacillus oenotherae]
MDIQSISAAASGQAMAQLKQQAGIAVMAKSLDNMQLQGQLLIKMMEQSVQPHLGGNLDIRL